MICVFDDHCSGETGTEQMIETQKCAHYIFFHFVLLMVGGTSLKRDNTDISVTCAAYSGLAR